MKDVGLLPTDMDICDCKVTFATENQSHDFYFDKVIQTNCFMPFESFGWAVGGGGGPL